jgi:hypothetical protein
MLLVEKLKRMKSMSITIIICTSYLFVLKMEI